MAGGSVGPVVLWLIGYWQGPLAQDGYPDVRDFIDVGVAAERRAELSTYLRSGMTFVASAGFSVCRICGVDNGSTDVKGQDEVLSDGLWFSSWADSRIPCWWPGDLRGG
jgi:hypothetical protein